MKNFLKNNFLYALLAIFCFVVAYFFHYPIDSGYRSITSQFEDKLHHKEKRLNQEMDLLAEKAKTQNFEELFIKKPAYYNNLLENSGLALLIYENDTLKFWSDNSIAVENWIKEVCLDTRMVKLRNGWFEVMRPVSNASNSKSIIGLILIKNEYPYQNKYLTNDFEKSFDVPLETNLIINPLENRNEVKNNQGDYLFSLQFNSDNSYSGARALLSVLFNLAGILFFLLFLWKLRNEYGSKIGKNRSLLLFAALLITLRYISIKLGIPKVFYDYELFNPSIYADASSVWYSSLGDLLINTILFFILSYLVIRRLKISAHINKLGKPIRLSLLLLLTLSYFTISWELTSLLISLTRNSDIPFSINNLFSINRYTYIAIIISSLLLLTFFIITDKITSILKYILKETHHVLLVTAITAIIHIFALHLLGIRDLIIILWPWVLLISITLIKQKYTRYTFSYIVTLVFLFSFFAAHIFIKFTNIKELESRKIYAEKLAAERDPVAEFLFDEIKEKIENDSVLIDCVSKNVKNIETFEKRIKQEYFSGFWEKYDIHIDFFDSLCSPILLSAGSRFDNTFFFDELIQIKGAPTSSPFLTFINNQSGKINYIAKIPLINKKMLGNLYIEMNAKFISDEIGFPELLLDRNISLSQELNDYSYAKYKNNKLISQYGSFPYSLSAIGFISGIKVNPFETQNKEGYHHLLYKPDKSTLIVLSKEADSIVDQITIFSYLFTFFSLLFLSLLVAKQALEGKLIGNFSFKYRIQSLLVIIVLTSLALFGGGTVYYIKQQFELGNEQDISEKSHSVIMAMEPDFSDQKNLSKGIMEYVTFNIKKWANVFFTDINLFDTNGNLYTSSRPEVFNEGLTSKKMNPEAFVQMAVLSKIEYTHDERIGKLDYLSTYIPFKNHEGKILAYLNIPYFAKQNELEKKISDFLVALINIYVLLFALSVVVALFISNYVTKPLKLIQEKLGQIKLGKTNELIEWPEKDEIGNLVSEYNRMIMELSKSAELLAKSERENAWREMAKQVAHEIKNPLTPMKLSIQHLMRVWKDDAPDVEEKMERLSQTIIEQIDTLSTIATEFSNFAKMPKAYLEEINLQQVLQNSISLFQETENNTITLVNLVEDEPIVIADKDQLLRVFNNLIKNSIQAIPENKPGKIEIKLEQEEQTYLISIRDNGSGISDEALEKIFVPNFTTKTTGMGLGLAMVKGIIESINGKIWFKTSLNIGTTFFVSLPALTKEPNTNLVK